MLTQCSVSFNQHTPMHAKQQLSIKRSSIFSTTFVVLMPITMNIKSFFFLKGDYHNFTCYSSYFCDKTMVANKAQLNANHALVVFSHSLDSRRRRSRSCICSRPSFFLSALLLCRCVVLNPITFLCFALAFAFVYECVRSQKVRRCLESRRGGVNTKKKQGI